jgi:hypothetical protein
MPTSAVLIGSRPSIPTTTISVTANAVAENLVFAGGDYYLHHNTGSLSLLTAFVALLNGHSQLVGTASVVTRSRRVLTTNAIAFSVTSWGADTTLRDLLGYTGVLGSATDQLATNISPLLWSPRKIESSSARMGADGVLRKDTYAGRSAPGVVTATENNTWHENALTWRYVHVDRIEQVPDVPGTFAYWWDEVLSRFRRFYVARSVEDDTSDTTTAMDLTTSRIPAVGRAYIYQHDGPMVRPHNRTIENLELYGTVEIPVETALEYGA